MNIVTTKWSAVLVAALIPMTAGCGTIGIGDGPADASDSSVSPLADLMGWSSGTSAEQRTQQLAVEEAVSRCMRAEGFEYEPVDHSAQMLTNEADALAWEDPLAYGEKYGYGVVRNYEQYEEPWLLGEEPTDEDIWEDPNQDYVNSLSPSENEAYYRLLYGESIESEPVEDDPEDTAAPSGEPGCYEQANREVVGDQPMYDPEIESRVSDFYTSTRNQPEFEAAIDEWLACMRRDHEDYLESDVDGFEVTSPDSMYQLVDFRKSAAMGMTITGYEGDENGSSYSSDGDQKAIADADLEALRQLELAMWKADWDCQDQVDLRGAMRRAEQQLVDELLAEFPELAERKAGSS